jgi:uncharacterized repeat protein (TIGR01451 family)
MAFDQAGNLYATGFLTNKIDRFTPSGTSLTKFGSSFDLNPESIVFDAAGNAYVGQSDGSHRVLKFDPSGNLVDSYTVQIESRGSDWIELAPDQRTLYYTSEGHTIKRYDLVTRQQLPDFATGLPGNEAFQLQFLPDGSVLIADDHWILHLDTSGKIVQTYGYDPSNQWFNLVLDPDGKTFWSSDQGDGRVARFDISTGQQLESFNTVPGGAFGLAVVGEIRAATAASLTLGTVATTAETTVGQTVTYTVQVLNSGPATASNSVTTMALPTGATLISGTASQGGSPVVQGNVATFHLGDLTPGARALITLVLRADVPGTLTTIATASTQTPSTPTTAASDILTTSVVATTPVIVPPIVVSTSMMPRAHLGCCSSTAVVINFDQVMSAPQAQDLRNYRLSRPFTARNWGSNRGRGRIIPIRRAIYNPATRSVTLITRQPLNARWTYQLTISAGAAGLVSSIGIQLAGQPGHPGTDYTGYVVAARATAIRSSASRHRR